ncbi:MAG TPA: hypothetical protein VFI08_08450, partial [Spirochaetia bacterium]|nr:hypothetical protein [Spirochaetia bacterium]
MGCRKTVLRAARAVVGVATGFLVGCSAVSLSSLWSGSPSTVGSWTTVGGGTFTTTNVAYTSVAINKTTGTPYVAFEDGAAGAAVTVKRYSGGTWGYVGSAGFSGVTAESVHIAGAPDGTLYVAYTHPSAGLYYANVMSYTPATGWLPVGSADFVQLSTSWTATALALDPGGTPFLAYRDSTLDRVVVQEWTGSSWMAVGSSSSFNTGPSNISLAVDSGGNPWVAYEDGG